MSKWVKAWHFMADKGGKPVLRDGSPAPKVRKILRYDGEIKICNSGLHASRRLIDALEYAPGPWCAEVEVREIAGEQSDKLVARERRILRVINSDMVLWRFSCDVASRALEDAGVTDERSWTAITARQGHMVGMVSDEDLDAARDAAWAASWDASRAASWDASRAASMAASRADSRAALSAALSAASWAASSAASWAASWDASRAASSDASWAASRDAQNDHLEHLMREAMR